MSMAGRSALELTPLYFSAALSSGRLEVRFHHALLPQLPSELQNLAVVGLLARAGEVQRLHGDAQSEFVSILEAVSQSSRGAVDTQRDTVDFVGFNSFVECCWVERIHPH